MKIKVLLAALFCTLIGIPLVAGGLYFEPTIWEAVVVGSVATLTGPVVAGLVARDLLRSRQGVSSEVAEGVLDLLKP